MCQTNQGSNIRFKIHCLCDLGQMTEALCTFFLLVHKTGGLSRVSNTNSHHNNSYHYVSAKSKAGPSETLSFCLFSTRHWGGDWHGPLKLRTGKGLAQIHIAIRQVLSAGVWCQCHFWSETIVPYFLIFPSLFSIWYYSKFIPSVPLCLSYITHHSLSLLSPVWLPGNASVFWSVSICTHLC